MKNQPETPEALAHALFTAAQLAPGEGIEDAVGRLAALVEAQQHAPSAAVALSDDLRDGLVAISAAIADQDDRAAQAMLREILAAPQPSTTPPADSHPAPVAQGDAEDAARYRRIRRGQHWSVIDGSGNELRAEALDSAIDAARGLPALADGCLQTTRRRRRRP